MRCAREIDEAEVGGIGSIAQQYYKLSRDREGAATYTHFLWSWLSFGSLGVLEYVNI